MKVLQKIGKRLKEPSTWSALGALLALFGIQVDPGLLQDIATGVGGVAAVGGILLREKGSDD